MQITRCLHTAILVSDLQKAEEFYGQVLGLSKVERSLNYPGAWYQLGEYQIHLIVDSQVKITSFNNQKWGRNAHLAFSVNDINAAQERLQKKGYPLQLSSSDRPALFTKDADGNVIELSQL